MVRSHLTHVQADVWGWLPFCKGCSGAKPLRAAAGAAVGFKMMFWVHKNPGGVVALL